MTIYVPKQIVVLKPTHKSPLFFLAGPIRGGGDWQAEMAEEIIRTVPDALIVCPSRWSGNHHLASHFNSPFNQALNRQLVWERHYLKQAGLEVGIQGCVVFWLGSESKEQPHPGPEPYAMDTRREIGKFTAYVEVLRDFPSMCEKLNVRIVVGGHPDFYGLDVIMDELSNAAGHKVPFHANMTQVVQHAYLKSQV